MLSPEICDILQELDPGKNGELWLTDAIEAYIQRGNPVVTQPIWRRALADNRDPLHFLEALLEYARDREEYWEGFKQYFLNYKKPSLKKLGFSDHIPREPMTGLYYFDHHYGITTIDTGFVRAPDLTPVTSLSRAIRRLLLTSASHRLCPYFCKSYRKNALRRSR